MVSNYADIIVMRHYLEGAARYASEIAPVISLMLVTGKSTSFSDNA